MYDEETGGGVGPIATNCPIDNGVAYPIGSTQYAWRCQVCGAQFDLPLDHRTQILQFIPVRALSYAGKYADPFFNDVAANPRAT